ncbi:hypothetical protein [Chryseobacterium gossypii]|uniref:hypothetical protein n=1 Tax=Chryseobacterium gossypii TaxID=3231602 RepID=UPI003523360B
MEATQLKQNVKPVFNTLKFTFTIIPVAAGLDKFTNILCDWSQYINPAIHNMLPFSDHTFMMIVGIIEIIAGILVFTRPKTGGLIVSA